MAEKRRVIEPVEQFTQYRDGLFSTVCINDDDSLPVFLRQKGASEPDQLLRFLYTYCHVQRAEDEESVDLSLRKSGGCSVCSVKSQMGGYLFGRNFDFQRCNMIITKSKPKTGYASVSTVNPDFIRSAIGPDEADPARRQLYRLLVYYLPMDGMNECGLCVSINNIRDKVDIHQTQSAKPDHMVSTLVRTLLNCASDVNEAIDILKNSNFHTANSYLTHLVIADTAGRCICAEYIDNRLSITDSSVITNHYLTPGEKHGIGTRQSHERFRRLLELIDKKKNRFSHDDLKRALSSVAKSNFPADGERFTEWSVIYDQTSLSAVYYRREDYENAYEIQLPGNSLSQAIFDKSRMERSRSRRAVKSARS